MFRHVGCDGMIELRTVPVMLPNGEMANIRLPVCTVCGCKNPLMYQPGQRPGLEIARALMSADAK